MKLPFKIHLQRSAILLLVWLLLIACSLLPYVKSATSTAAAPGQSTGAATLASGQAVGTAKPTGAPGGQPGATATPTANNAASGSGPLAISNSYPFFTTKLILGESITASPGKIWIGTITGTIEEVDSQSGVFGQTISLTPGTGGSAKILFPIMKLRFEGQYLWAWGNLIENGVAHPYLFAIDSGSGTVADQWYLDSPEWLGKGRSRMFPPDDFGVSPGKIWIDGHVIDTQSFEVKQDIPMPGMTLFAYNGKGWMWMTGDAGGECDDLVLGNVDDPSKVRCPSHWPFLIHTQDGQHTVGPASPLVLAGDRMWIGGGWSGTEPTYVLEAYSADLDQAMQETKPLASVPLMDSYQKIRMLFAGNYLWVVYTLGVKAGFLYQLDPQTGTTINSLDLVGAQARSISDIPVDMATEGDNLWVLTTRQLLRIKLP
jgi:hypothetical protein